MKYVRLREDYPRERYRMGAHVLVRGRWYLATDATAAGASELFFDVKDVDSPGGAMIGDVLFSPKAGLSVVYVGPVTPPGTSLVRVPDETTTQWRRVRVNNRRLVFWSHRTEATKAVAVSVEDVHHSTETSLDPEHYDDE